MDNKPPEECKQCKDLNAKCPEGNMSQEEMLMKYHPNARIVRTTPGDLNE
jgi:hypothetical protein